MIDYSNKLGSVVVPFLEVHASFILETQTSLPQETWLIPFLDQYFINAQSQYVVKQVYISFHILFKHSVSKLISQDVIILLGLIKEHFYHLLLFYLFFIFYLFLLLVAFIKLAIIGLIAWAIIVMVLVFAITLASVFTLVISKVFDTFIIASFLLVKIYEPYSLLSYYYQVTTDITAANHSMATIVTTIINLDLVDQLIRDYLVVVTTSHYHITINHISFNHISHHIN